MRFRCCAITFFNYGASCSTFAAALYAFTSSLPNASLSHRPLDGLLCETATVGRTMRSVELLYERHHSVEAVAERL